MLDARFVDWCHDLKFSEMVMYGNAYGVESSNTMISKAYQAATHNKYIKEERQTFEDFLIECFNRELGDKDEITR